LIINYLPFTNLGWLALSPCCAAAYKNQTTDIRLKTTGLLACICWYENVRFSAISIAYGRFMLACWLTDAGILTYYQI